MIRAVLDTNLLVSYLLVHRPPISVLIDKHLAAKHFFLLTAPALLQELDRVLSYLRLQRYYNQDTHDRFVALVAALSEWIELPNEIPSISRDADDDRVIACAVIGRAGFIVTGDQDLLCLGKIGDIPILTAAQFLDHLENTSSSIEPNSYV